MSHVSLRPTGRAGSACRAFLLASTAFVLPGSSLAAQKDTSTDLPPVIVTSPKAKPAQEKKAAKVKTPVKPAPVTPAQPVQASAPSSEEQTAASTPAAESRATPPIVQKFQLPQKAFSVTARKLEETVNVKDPEDAVKYMPSLVVRKRNDSDNQAVLATRTWGLNSSARTLIYQDDLLISALIGNNNTAASPRWNLVSPEAIARVDFLSGPFAAAYPGNSLGGVLLITTKMPEKLEASVKETVSIMPWQQYGTKDTYISSHTGASIGSKTGAASWFLSSTFVDTWQQPLTYVTNGSAPAGTNGTIPALNKTGAVANVVGAGTLAHSQQNAVNAKLAVDFTPWIKGTYSLSLWVNDQTSNPQTYLTSQVSGAATFGGVSGFASGKYAWDQIHLSNAVSLKSDTKGAFDFDLSASTYNYLEDIQVNPYTVGSGATFSTNGRITRNDGTNWQNADAKFIWRPEGWLGAHEVSFGLHGDRYRFENPVYASSVWFESSDTGTGKLYSMGSGETQTGALWVQDAWRVLPDLKLTLGGRLETWRAIDGFNLNTVASASGVINDAKTKSIDQPEQDSTNFSPKASLSYDLNRIWNITASFGQAYRYPTVTELYQNISLGSGGSAAVTFANPSLRPEEDFNGELSFEGNAADGRVRLTLFKEHTNDAIISQSTLVTNPVTNAQVLTNTISNVDAIEMQGVELAAEKDNVAVAGLQVFGSVTYASSEILADAAWKGANPVVGKNVPYVPDWRAKFGFTYRPTDTLAWTVAARYSGTQYSTLDNSDAVGHVYGAFDRYFVVDTKLHYQASQSLLLDFGVDNVLDEQYMLFHPFPGRTFVFAGKWQF